MLISTTANVLSVSNGVRRNERAGTAAARLLDRAKATTKQIHETASVMKKNLSEDPTTPFLYADTQRRYVGSAIASQI